jgi:hypothetical protein
MLIADSSGNDFSKCVFDNSIGSMKSRQRFVLLNWINMTRIFIFLVLIENAEMIFMYILFFISLKEHHDEKKNHRIDSY